MGDVPREGERHSLTGDLVGSGLQATRPWVRRGDESLWLRALDGKPRKTDEVRKKTSRIETYHNSP